MPDETTLTVSSDHLSSLRDDAAARLARGEIDEELHADLAYLIEAEAQDEVMGREPLRIDYGSRIGFSKYPHPDSNRDMALRKSAALRLIGPGFH